MQHIKNQGLMFTLEQIISGFDTIQEVKAFLYNNKTMKQLSTESINQICWAFDLTKRLENIGLDASKLCDFLRKHKAGITGSFILQIIKGIAYDESDIDIFVEKITPEIISEFEGMVNAKGRIVMTHDYNHADKRAHKIVSKLAEFIVAGKKMQFIEPHRDYNSLEKYVNTFDFDICKNFFDGSNFYVTNLYNIMNNKALYDETYFNKRAFGEEDLIEKTYVQFIKRACKYHSRGYDILFSASFIKSLMAEKNTAFIHAFNGDVRLMLLRDNKDVTQSKFDFVMKCMNDKLVIC